LLLKPDAKREELAMSIWANGITDYGSHAIPLPGAIYLARQK